MKLELKKKFWGGMTKIFGGEPRDPIHVVLNSNSD